MRRVHVRSGSCSCVPQATCPQTWIIFAAFTLTTGPPVSSWTAHQSGDVDTSSKISPIGCVIVERHARAYTPGGYGQSHEAPAKVSFATDCTRVRNGQKESKRHFTAHSKNGQSLYRSITVSILFGQYKFISIRFACCDKCTTKQVIKFSLLLRL